jgi:hypothetical protein
LQLTYTKGTRNFCLTPIIYNQFVIKYRPLDNNTAFTTVKATITPKEPIPKPIPGCKTQLKEVPNL